MPRRITVLVALTVIVATVISSTPRLAPAADLDPEAVKKAIDRGVAYLKSQQKDGVWPDDTRIPHGVTGLCTLALLSCGLPANDPAVAAAVGKLRRIGPNDLNKTYSVALHALVLAQADPQKHLLQIGKDVAWLEQAQIKNGRNRGCWTYTISDGEGAFRGDNSNAQFAVLALYEAERAGVKVNRRTWELALDYWRRSQNSDGSWGYVNNKDKEPGAGSTTSAGIAAYIMCSGRLHEPDAKVTGDAVQCCGRTPDVIADPVERGYQWLAKNFSVSRNPTARTVRNLGDEALSYHYYYLYALERVGRLTSQRWIGDHDWYREGTELLVQGSNKPDALTGAWIGRGLGESDNNIATALVLLFLSKGQRPVLMSKLEYGDQWNQHRHDIANLTESVELRWRKLQPDLNLTWQILPADRSTLDDLKQTPVLFIGGKKSLPLDAELKKRLRAYVDQGGFIFAENTCDDPLFDAAFRAMLTEVFPGMTLEALDDPSHPIWNADEVLKPQYIAKHPLFGLNAGCRLGVVYCPKPLSAYWELSRAGYDTTYPPAVQEEIDFCLGMGANVLAYATNRKLKFKFENFVKSKTEAPHDASRSAITVAKLRHNGGCNEAPQALQRMAELAGEHLKITVHAEKELIDITDDRLFEYHLVFMHGKRDFNFSPEERKRLKLYIEQGGTLLVDALASSPEFTKAFRTEMSKIFPGQPLEAIDVSNPMIKPPADNIYDAYNIEEVSFRQPVGGEANDKRTVKISRIPPKLEGVKIKDRYGVIFSPYDLSCALESLESLQFPGYSRQDAAKITLNILLYTLRQ
jgi:hypothetical protein